MSEYSVKRKYTLVAPDGGWGYMICISVVIILSTIGIYINCYGVLFNELFLELHMGSTAVTALNGVNAMCGSISGLLTSPLLKFFSIRQLAVFAAVLFNTGLLGTVLTRSKTLLFLFQGLIQGIGVGLLYNLSLTILTSYFVKKRLLAISLTHAVPAVITLLAPQFVKWSQERFGSNGTLMLLCGFALHVIVSAILMQPVMWHMKKLEIITLETETKLLLTNSNIPEESQIPTIKLSDSVFTAKSLNDENDLKVETGVKPKNKLKTFLSEFTDPYLLKTYILSNASVGIALTTFADYVFLIMTPQALYSMEWNEGEVAWALSLLGLGDVFTRIIFIFSSTWLSKVGSHELYLIGLVLSFMTRLGFLWWDNMYVMLAFITIMGVSRCITLLLVPMVIADTVKPEKFSAATGILMMLIGIFSFVLGPVIGAVRDLTNSYATAFYILTSCFGIVILFWSIELLYKKNEHKRKPK